MTANLLILKFNRNPSTSNADGDDAFISFLESISGDQSIDHLRFPLQVALLISPIFLLQDIQIHLSQIQRYKLAMVFPFHQFSGLYIYPCAIVFKSTWQ
jgi:hypothetical protein